MDPSGATDASNKKNVNTIANNILSGWVLETCIQTVQIMMLLMR